MGVNLCVSNLVQDLGSYLAWERRKEREVLILQCQPKDGSSEERGRDFWWLVA